MTPNVATDLKHGLVIGSNTLIGPYGYISLSGPGMLTHQGRRGSVFFEASKTLQVLHF